MSLKGPKWSMRPNKRLYLTMLSPLGEQKTKINITKQTASSYINLERKKEKVMPLKEHNNLCLC